MSCKEIKWNPDGVTAKPVWVTSHPQIPPQSRPWVFSPETQKASESRTLPEPMRAALCWRSPWELRSAEGARDQCGCSCSFHTRASAIGPDTGSSAALVLATLGGSPPCLQDPSPLTEGSPTGCLPSQLMQPGSRAWVVASGSEVTPRVSTPKLSLGSLSFPWGLPTPIT